MVGGVAAVFHDMAAGMGVRIWSRERLAIKICTVQTRSRNFVRGSVSVLGSAMEIN